MITIRTLILLLFCLVAIFSGDVGWSESKRIGLQRTYAPDDGQHVRQNVHCEFPAGDGRVAPFNRHQRRHRVTLGLIQGTSRADPVALVFRSRPNESRQFRVHAVTLGRAVRELEMRDDSLSERT